MLRPHCDRCDKLCDEYQKWVEDTVETQLSTAYPIWHIVIYAGGPRSAELHDVPCDLSMFCRACRIAILEAHVAVLKSTKGDGGHLADCQWEASYKRYRCADGCEIKRINESRTGGIADGML